MLVLSLSCVLSLVSFTPGLSPFPGATSSPGQCGGSLSLQPPGLARLRPRGALAEESRR